MKIEMVKTGDLIPYHNNPRKNDGAVKYVASSIKEFGFKVPIVIDECNVIVTGHTRHKAAVKLGLKEVPCISANDLTLAQIKAFRIADNKTAEFAEWDLDLLKDELAELDEMDIDFDFDFENLNENGTIERTDLSEKISDEFLLIIEYANEKELESGFEKLTKEGYQCRISTY